MPIHPRGESAKSAALEPRRGRHGGEPTGEAIRVEVDVGTLLSIRRGRPR